MQQGSFGDGSRSIFWTGVLQLRAGLRSISPLIWRRLLVRGDTSVARLHQILQVALGWQDMHLHRFEIRGREYGVHQEGGILFDTNAHEALSAN